MADATAHSVPVMQHGRFLVSRPGEAGPWPLLVGFHGYAENAETMHAVLDRLPGADGWLRVSIQGLHRFYHPKRGDVIASWMTREDRELAIADNIAYVDAVLDRLEREHGRPPCVVHVGFSQGAAMAWRASLRCARRADGLVAFGGDIPPELRDDLAASPRVLVARGDTDEWYTAAQFEADLASLLEHGARHEGFAFAGGHAWSEPVLARAGVFLEAVRQGTIR